MWELLANVANVIGVLGAVFAGFAWHQAKALRDENHKEKRRLGQRIEILLDCQERGQCFRLPVWVIRKDFSRAEVHGVLGMLPMKTPADRFALSYLATEEFLVELARV